MSLVTKSAIDRKSRRMDEEQRIRLSYSLRRDDSVTYSFFNPGHLFMVQQLERGIVRLFDRHHVAPLEDKRILDIGCGVGSRLRQFINYGARPENLCGIDLLPRAVHEAKKISPNIDFRCGNAENLPFKDASFDMVTQFTVFTSILDDRMKMNTGKEMLRVLKRDGIILWYDYFVSKPTNRDVRGVGKEEIARLFPECTNDFARTTLAPPIARTIAPYSFLLCHLLEKIPWLRTHYLVVIRKKEGTGKQVVGSG